MRMFDKELCQKGIETALLLPDLYARHGREVFAEVLDRLPQDFSLGFALGSLAVAYSQPQLRGGTNV